MSTKIYTPQNPLTKQRLYDFFESAFFCDELNKVVPISKDTFCHIYSLLAWIDTVPKFAKIFTNKKKFIERARKIDAEMYDDQQNSRS